MTIRLTFHGAARSVTGSCYLLEIGKTKLLVDCGMFQGSKTERELNYRAFPFSPSSLDSVLLTHAHIDHSGLLPKLVKHGYNGRIHATEATIDLCSIMLPDSGFIQEMEVRQLNPRRLKRGEAEVQPIYTLLDAEGSLEYFDGHAYKTWFEPVKGVRARFWNAGHLLGSASIEMEIDQSSGTPLRLLFSGDIGPENKMLEPDPEAPTHFDHVISESTYGGRRRFERSESGRRANLAKEINDAAARKGAMLIPSFAVERTQELVTDIVRLMDEKVIPPAAIFIDSPLASKATEIFKKHSRSLQNGGDLLHAFSSPHVKVTESVDDSKALQRFTGFRIIIAASGMCEAGRIRHHLKNHLWQSSTTVLLSGFQAEGSLGRILQEGASKVTIMGETISVKATIRLMEDYSGHADGVELVEWIKARLPITRSLFITHGEKDAQLALAEDIYRLGLEQHCVVIPALDSVYDIEAPQCALLTEETRPRIDPLMVARLDSHNDLANLVLDIRETLDKAGDEKSKNVILRRLRRALRNEKLQDHHS